MCPLFCQESNIALPHKIAKDFNTDENTVDFVIHTVITCNVFTSSFSKQGPIKLTTRAMVRRTRQMNYNMFIDTFITILMSLALFKVQEDHKSKWPNNQIE